MSRLSVLRSRLRQLQRRRMAVRVGSVLSLLASVVIVSWILLFALDVGLHLSWLARVVVLAAWVGGLAVMLRRFVDPLFTKQETLADVALVVERAHGIDSDLVAALQFDNDGGPFQQSHRLTSATIDYVAEFSQTLDVYRGFSWNTVPQRLLTAFISFALVAILAGMAPAHARVFWNRFWLGSAQYPTQTQIASIQVDQTNLEFTSRTPLRIPFVQNQPLTIEVRTTGTSPAFVRAVVQSQTNWESTVWTFNPLPVANPTTDGSTHFQYRAESIPESVQVTVQAGDAISPPFSLDLQTLPLLELDWSVTPPSYASELSMEPVAAGSRRLSALQGSRIRLAVHSINKPFKLVTLICGERSYSLRPSSQTASASRHSREWVWQLPHGSPLDSLQENLSYEVQAVDEDGLSAAPMTGEIRLRQDQSPKVTATVLSRRVLPTAVPQIEYEALDDFGLRAIRWQMEIVRSNGKRQSTTQTAWTLPDRSPMLRRQRGLIGAELMAYNLAKGDEVQITLLAEDERGGAESATGRSDPIVLEITDRNGILESLLEIDQQSAQQLDEIIDRELGIGKSSP